MARKWVEQTIASSLNFMVLNRIFLVVKWSKRRIASYLNCQVLNRIFLAVKWMKRGIWLIPIREFYIFILWLEGSYLQTFWYYRVDISLDYSFSRLFIFKPWKMARKWVEQTIASGLNCQVLNRIFLAVKWMKRRNWLVRHGSFINILDFMYVYMICYMHRLSKTSTR